MATPLVPLESGGLSKRGPRSELLLALKRSGQLTAKELAAELRLSLNAVRHHLKELELEQLVVHERQQRGVGAPVFAYRLAPAGEARFPRRYEEPLSQVLDHVVAREGRAAAVGMLEHQFEELGRRLAGVVEGASPVERLRAVARVLSDEGYMAEWGTAAEGGKLAEHNCPIKLVAERFPEICAAEARFLAAALGGSIERRTHMLEGCGTCEYDVKFAEGQDQPSRHPKEA
jgi:DeoR family transcriptional regulator, suf operon transcriptional repressor